MERVLERPELHLRPAFRHKAYPLESAGRNDRRDSGWRELWNGSCSHRASMGPARSIWDVAEERSGALKRMTFELLAEARRLAT